MRRNMVRRTPPPAAPPVPNARFAGASTSRATGAGPRSLTLTRTDTPGVYRNQLGQFCDHQGLELTWEEIKAADDARFLEVMGYVPTTPGEFLKGVSLDPRQPFDVRLSAARAGAPYFDMRMPLRVEGQVDHKGMLFDPAKLATMKKDDRQQLLKLLGHLGVTL